MWKAAISEFVVGADAASPRTLGVYPQAAAASREFDAHLSRFNARRLRSASWCFAAAMLVLLATNIALPSLRLWQHAGSQVIAILYFVAFGVVCRLPRAADWPTPLLPLLFGLGTAATGLVFSRDLTPYLGANPAYVIPVFIMCLAPLWPRRLLLAILVPVHVIYLLDVFAAGETVSFLLVMGIGGTLAVVLGWFVATLQYRAERQAFDATAAISEQKDQLATALARVSYLLDERSEMVAIVAHDLQSPLAGIRALLRTLAHGSDSDATKLNEISRTCAEMQNAIGRLLAAHAAETSQSAPVVVDIEQLFTRLAASAAPAAAEKNIAVVCDANKRRTRSDPVALETALRNLLSNAIKFSPAGSVVRVNAQSYGKGVRISVIDRGPGIAASEAGSLFKKFAALSPRPTGGEPTSGLGLYIVHSLAERISAVVGYAPNPEGGSVFFLDLPNN
ncbi:MAG: HAMP domain-containing histidine kinase [Xanthobacteraceae bacterium]|nr:HAMP domain-containing histidine kinase [Xanthobacteraceae bacterium]